ncbi:MAG: methyl-accepting chemotaxis protein [Myxococcales bacterium]|nr:methyl-accepting chemotaxis protein [Myxococcales bacterium]
MSLSWAIFIFFAVALVIILLVLYLIVPAQARAYLEGTLAQRGNAVAREVKRKVKVARGVDVNEAALEIERVTEGDREVQLVAVLYCAPHEQCEMVAVKPGVDPKLVQDVREEFISAEQPLGRHPLRSGALLVADSVAPASGEGVGYVLVVLDRKVIEQAVGQLERTVLVALGIGCIVFLLLVWFISRWFILQPLGSMLAVASKLSEADLSGRVEEVSTSELGSLADALNGINQSLRDTLGRVRGVSEGVAQVIEQISLTGQTVTSGASTALQRVEETSSSMVEMMASLRGIAENVEVLYQSAEESSSSIMEMAATNDEVAENVQAMAHSVQETTAAIEQMTNSIKEVAKNIEELYASTEETSSSMSEMDISIGQVETNANETARLSEQASKDSELGVESLQKTMAGIDKIKESSRTALSVIESLGKRIQEIGNILNVIDEVAEQTNLLALNAAIIAAQAGEHGKGFAVVAEEIKDLAERTGASTKEIADLIRSVQEESRNAVAAMNQGVRNVEEGVLLGREAEGALKKIFDSANKSTMMVKAIARATVEQARGSKQVTASIQRIARTVQQVSEASNAQAKGTEQIMKGAEKMKLITAHVQRSSQEQAHGSKQITKSIESINEMVTHLNRAQKEQTKGSEQVLKAVETIKSVSEHQSRSVKQLEEAIESLRQQADVLRAEVRRFKV